MLGRGKLFGLQRVGGGHMKAKVLALLSALWLLPLNAQAQSWPQRPITLIVPFPAGGGTDAFARPLATQLDAQLGTRVLIENRAGAGGTLGAGAAARAAPDGYTFFVGAAHHAIAPSIYPKLTYDIRTDFMPIALISRPPHVVAVNPGTITATTLVEFINYARAHQMNYASGGVGTTHHLAGELFNVLAKTKLTHVPYRGSGPAMQDLLAGHVPVMFDGLGTSASQISGGTLRALAVAASERVSAFPNLPTSAEAGLPGFEVSTWYGLFAPKDTPAPVIDRMIKEVTAALQIPALKEAWVRNGSDTPEVVGAQFGALVTSEVDRWHRVVAEAGVKVE
jgi:tripartite-type tricarboxylate transporter receptor subunit TctC